MINSMCDSGDPCRSPESKGLGGFTFSIKVERLSSVGVEVVDPFCEVGRQACIDPDLSESFVADHVEGSVDVDS